MHNHNHKSKIALTAMSIMALMAGLNFAIPAGVSHAAVADWQKGVNIPPNYNTDFSSSNFQQAVRNAAATGANYIFLEIPLYQSNIYSTDVQTGSNTPTDQSLADAITFIHSLGLHAALKFEDFPYDGQWSANINPSDRNTWFTNYGNQVTHFATVAAENGADEIVLGTELIDMTSASVNGTNTGNWEALIGKVRAVFPGKLTYSANWGGDSHDDELDNINFWSSLDYIGISAYYNLTGDGSVNSLMQSWDSWKNSTIQPVSARWGKPVIFTEIGYKAISDSYTHPWMWWESGNADPQAQANDYQALFQYWNGQPYMQGVALWYWGTDPNGGGSGNIDYTPQNKAAQGVMQQWFSQAPSGSTGSGSGSGSGSGAGTVSTGTSSSTGTFAASATASPPAPNPGAATTVALDVTNANGASSNVNVDAEIYDPNNTRVFQQIFTGQNFSNNGTNHYPLSWTAGGAGSYALKVGVFSSDWGTLYYWNNDALTIPVGGNGSATSTGSGGTGGNTSSTTGGSGGTGAGSGSSTGTAAGTVNIWWPADGATVSGVQPFKAMLTNNDVSQYNMFWQVDNGQWNPMSNNSTDWPHKEALVDLGPWTWNSNGSYSVSFIAQNLGGQTVAQSTVTIHVTH